MKKNASRKVQWKKQRELPKMNRKTLIIGAAWESIAVLLLIFVAISMLTKFSEYVTLGVNEVFFLLVAVTGTVFFYEVLVAGILNRVNGTKKKWLLRIGSKVLPAIVIFLILLRYQTNHADELEGGFRMFTKYYYKAYDFLFNTSHVVREAPVDWIPVFLGFLAAMAFFAIYFLSWIGRRKWLMLLLPASSLTLIMYAGLAPSFGHLVVMALGLFMIYNSHRKSEEAYVGAVCVLGFLLFAMILLGGIFSGSAEKLLEKALQAKAVQEKVEEEIKSQLASFRMTNKQTINNSPPEFRDKKVLTIRADKLPQGNLYLQDFYGERYENNEWTFSRREFAKACSENGISQSEAAKRLASNIYKIYCGDLKSLYETWLGGSYYFSSDISFKKYEVMEFQEEYQSFMSSSMLLPYGADVEQVSGIKFLRDAIAQKGGLKKSITCQCWDSNAFEFEGLRVSGNMDQEELKFWAWYNDYAKDHYLDYPKYVKDTPVFDYAEAMVDGEKYYGITENEIRHLAVVAVQSILTGPNSIYSWEMDKLEAGEDPIEHFLKNARKGYCIHYASLGVMLLRSLGVPARYASGYVVKPASFVLQEDGSYAAEVIDRNGHAWAEVYYNDVGWVPIEMTPGYSSTSESVPTFQQPKEEKTNVTIDPVGSKEQTSSSEETPEETEKPEETETPKETPDAEETFEQGEEEKPGVGLGEGSEDGVQNGLFTVVIILTGIAVAGVLIVFVGRKALAEVRLEKAMTGKYYKAATLMINRKVYRKVKAKGKQVRNAKTDREFAQALLEVLGEEQASAVEKYMRIVKAAAFSNASVSKGDCLYVWHVYQDLKEK